MAADSPAGEGREDLHDRARAQAHRVRVTLSDGLTVDQERAAPQHVSELIALRSTAGDRGGKRGAETDGESLLLGRPGGFARGSPVTQSRRVRVHRCLT